ncbi:MAG: DNA polymerase Y family protein [Bacteroidota bacterium]|nr:DNA polymerase Y family protein [Bacteroidota bacterium]
MPKRFLSIYFTHFAADRMARHHPELRDQPFLLSAHVRGRMVVKDFSPSLEQEGIRQGMVVADVKAIYPSIKVFPDDPAEEEKHLKALAEWSIRYTPLVASDFPDGLLLDISGCPHLWGGERPYLETITGCFQHNGYDTRAAIADTIGAAWAVAHFGQNMTIVEPDGQAQVLQSLPPAAIRLDAVTLDRLEKLGFKQVGQFSHIPRPNLRRRFGEALLNRLDQALGKAPEALEYVKPTPLYREQLPCIEPIRTAPGIGFALKRLLESLCERLAKEGKGLRSGIFICHRIDGKTVQISIGTNRASCNAEHLFKLFELKIPTLEPALGIELFELEASLVEEVSETQESLWATENTDHKAISELLDRIAGKVGMNAIHRYLPQDRYWPELSIREATTLNEKPETDWCTERLRPLHLLAHPEPVEVMVPLPDYPPVHFRYKGKLYNIVKADGPERIEQEWWIQTGPPRDYYQLEDENGARYWLFRLGLYDGESPKWFLHGYFA